MFIAFGLKSCGLTSLGFLIRRLLSHYPNFCEPKLRQQKAVHYLVTHQLCWLYILASFIFIEFEGPTLCHMCEANSTSFRLGHNCLGLFQSSAHELLKETERRLLLSVHCDDFKAS